jgi:hypothetical protein
MYADERHDGGVGQVEQGDGDEQHDDAPVTQQVAHADFVVVAARGALFVDFVAADNEDRRRRQDRHGRDRIEDGGDAGDPHEAHRQEGRGEIAGVVPALVGAHRAIQRGVSDEAEGQCSEQGNEKRLGDAGEEEEWVDPEGKRGDDWYESVTDAERQRGRGQKRPARPPAVDAVTRRRLRQEDPESSDGDGDPDRRFGPLLLFEVGPEKGHDDACDLGQKEIRGVEPDEALRRRIVALGTLRCPGAGWRLGGAHGGILAGGWAGKAGQQKKCRQGTAATKPDREAPND